MAKKRIFLQNLIWGFVLWLIGYVLGIVFFMIMPQNMIGWVIMPIGIVITLLVLLKRINRETFSAYLDVALVWTLMAIVLDFVFIALLFAAGASYYKVDVYIYYALTFALPLAVGAFKLRKAEAGKSDKAGESF